MLQQEALLEALRLQREDPRLQQEALRLQQEVPRLQQALRAKLRLQHALRAQQAPHLEAQPPPLPR
jgi:hypothetical protein